MSHFVMTQYSTKKGLKNYPKKGAEAVIKEMNQLHNWDAMDTIAYVSLVSEQNREDIISLIFLKEKQYRSTKRRACADGS